MRSTTSRRVSTLLLPLLVSAFVGKAHAGGPIAESGHACPRSTADGLAPHVTVRMYDYALAPAGVVERAQEVARRIVRAAGIETTWLNCRVSEDDPRVSDAACDKPVRKADVMLRLLPERMARTVGTPPSVCGFAKPPYVGFVFYNCASGLAEAGVIEQRHVILGHLLAHELGHMLLGREGHARKGIMRLPWSNGDLKRAERGQLLFTDGEGQRMCEQAFLRMQDNQSFSSINRFQAEAEGL